MQDPVVSNARHDMNVPSSQTKEPSLWATKSCKIEQYEASEFNRRHKPSDALNEGRHNQPKNNNQIP